MRKNVIRYIEKYNNKPPRIGQKVRSYYRNVTHLAKDKWGSDVKEAWQIVGYSFEEDSIEDIKRMLRYELSKLPSNLYTHDNHVVVIYNSGEMFKYYYYDDCIKISDFNLSKDTIRNL